MFLRNVGNHLQEVSQTRRLPATSSPPWEPQILESRVSRRFTEYPNLLPSLRMHGNVPSISLYAFMALWLGTRTTLPLPLGYNSGICCGKTYSRDSQQNRMKALISFFLYLCICVKSSGRKISIVLDFFGHVLCKPYSIHRREQHLNESKTSGAQFLP
jgi:hypothetical protein